MFTVTALPAKHGDCLWIEYGSRDAPHVVLIDAGPALSDALEDRLRALQARDGVLELVVVTHVDDDHIGGMLKVLGADFFGVPVKDFWFNGFRHLPKTDESFGPKQGEKLTALLIEKDVPWNLAFGGGLIAVDDKVNALPEATLAGGALITILSPDTNLLGRLRDVWVSVCGEANLYPDVVEEAAYAADEEFGDGTPDIASLLNEKFTEDTAEANGSSIGFVFEYAGKRVLFGADAYPSRLLKSLALPKNPNYAFALVKLPHHGSRNNVSPKLITSLRSPVYLFSSNGDKFRHPSPAAVARVIKFGESPQLAFNYRSVYTEVWEDPLLSGFGFDTDYGNDGVLKVKLA